MKEQQRTEWEGRGFVKKETVIERINEIKRAVIVYGKSQGRTNIKFQDVFLRPASVTTYVNIVVPYTYDTNLNKNLKASERFDVKGIIL